MDKRSEITAALKDALKNQDKIKSATLRLVTAALKDRDIAVREKGNAEGISDDEILMMMQTMIKQRQESAKTYSDAGRCDLAEREEKEIEVIRQFMPKQLSEQEIADLMDQLIEKTEAQSMKDMGKIMAILKNDYAGQIDMGKAGAIAKKKLG